MRGLEHLLFGMALLISVAWAQDLTTDARERVADAIYAAAATEAAFQRARDDTLVAQRRRIEALRAQWTALGGAHETLQAELALAQEQFVAELARRDRAYARDIAAYRNALESITSTPAGVEALRLFNAGQEVTALALLDELRRANDQARAVQRQAEAEADRRRIALLLLETRARRNLQFAGGEALIASVRDNVGAAVDRQILDGDLEGAAARLRVLVDAQAELVAADPRSPFQRFDLALLEERSGDVSSALSDFDAAAVAYFAARTTLTELDLMAPGDPLTRRALGVVLYKLARTPDTDVTWREVADHFEAMRRDGVLAQADEWILTELHARSAAQ